MNRLPQIRGTAALVRSLLDELDRLTHTDPLRAAIKTQIAEELAKLGCQIFESATQMSAERAA
jgi:hypothetical protein